MPSNKQRDLLKKKKEVEQTGKLETVFESAAICPVMENGKIVFKIMKIGFTLSGECVTLEEVDKARHDSTALNKLQSYLLDHGPLDIIQLRQLVKQVKEDNAKKTTKPTAD